MSQDIKCISFVNPKGGTGKTTSCVSIGGSLAKDGKKVLIVDFDPRANATLASGIDSGALKKSIYDVVSYSGYDATPITSVILKTKLDTGISRKYGGAGIGLAITKELVELLDRLLNKGLILNADVIISVAGVPLIGISLKAAIASIETMLEYGMMEAWDKSTREWYKKELTHVNDAMKFKEAIEKVSSKKLEKAVGERSTVILMEAVRNGQNT